MAPEAEVSDRVWVFRFADGHGRGPCGHLGPVTDDLRGILHSAVRPVARLIEELVYRPAGAVELGIEETEICVVLPEQLAQAAAVVDGEEFVMPPIWILDVPADRVRVPCPEWNRRQAFLRLDEPPRPFHTPA